MKAPVDLKSKQAQREKIAQEAAARDAHKVIYLANLLQTNSISYKEYNGDGGRVCLGGVVDWWTATGTAIARPDSKRYQFNLNDPKLIINVVRKYLR